MDRLAAIPGLLLEAPVVCGQGFSMIGHSPEQIMIDTDYRARTAESLSQHDVGALTESQAACLPRLPTEISGSARSRKPLCRKSLGFCA